MKNIFVNIFAIGLVIFAISCAKDPVPSPSGKTFVSEGESIKVEAQKK